MGKLNTDVSIVDYLKSKGQDSSYTSRKKLAEQYGISNYSGLGEQNTQLLQKLKSGTSTPAVKTSATPTVGSGASKTSVDKSQTGGTAKTATPQVSTPKAVATQPTYQRVQPVAPTYNYNVAAPTYTGSYDQQIASLYQNIMNTGSFNYDMNNDLLYKQYKDAYTKQADLSMRDTMGNAAALTGGYGSSYAGNVGQQAYNAQMDNLNNIVPQLADRAYGMYQDDISSKYNQLNATQKMSDLEYQKYLDSYNQWGANRDNAYNQYLGNLNQYNYENEFEYNQGIDDRNYQYQQERDSIADERYTNELDYQQERDYVAAQQYQNDFNYQQQRDKISDSQWESQFNYNKQQDARVASRSSGGSNKATTDSYAKGTKLYSQMKSDLSSDIQKMMGQTNEFGERSYSDDYISEWIMNMAENADMAEELMRAYGLWEAWGSKNTSSNNTQSTIPPLKANEYNRYINHLGNR